MKDLLIVDYWNKRINERMPVMYNHLLYGGYFQMPSARMGCAGEIGVGYAYVPPYRLWNLRCQLTDRLEVSGNYRIFSGVRDPVLSQHGFGDFSDKGANFKFSLFSSEDSGYQLPGVAIGCEDFIGTRAFKAQYIVMTQVLLEQNLEFSIGYGRHRIKGWFGGFCWIPFRKSCNPYLSPLAIVAEFDPTPYKRKHIEPHPEGRTKHTPFNVGVKYRLWDQIDLSASYIRGDAWAFSASTFYNFGETLGLIPKMDDPGFYKAPVNLEPLGPLRPEIVLATDLIYAFRDQGFTILQNWLGFDECGQKVLRLRVINNIYRLECQVRDRLNYLLAYLIPNDIEQVIVSIDLEGMVIQEYHYNMVYVRQFGFKGMGPFELKVLSPLCEATYPDPCSDWLLFAQRRKWFCLDLYPKTYTYFGSATGKFKYALGLQVEATGYLWNDIYYTTVLGLIGLENIHDVGDADRLNPSQLINVRTDIIRYYQQKGITLDQCYLQKNWNFGKGFFGRLSLGYFEVEYGGISGDLLYYPLKSEWAFGIEGAILGKRELNSWFGFTDKIRKLHGFVPTYHHFIGSQYFFNVYYDWKKAKLDLRIKAGKFLANDYGARFEVSRYFPSGLRITLWYTRTNGHDKINGKTYYDKGIAFTMPLDVFYTHCDQNTWGYGMSAWLRDVGVSGYTGQELYYMINDARK